MDKPNEPTIVPTTGPEVNGCAPYYLDEGPGDPFRTPKVDWVPGVEHEGRYLKALAEQAAERARTLAAEAVWKEAERRAEARRADSAA